MNITHLTYDYDIYYNGEKLDNIIDMEYEVIAGTIGGNYSVYIGITYIDGHIKHIKDISSRIAFVKRNESSKLCSAKEEYEKKYNGFTR